jgi:hypothetical protein
MDEKGIITLNGRFSQKGGAQASTRILKMTQNASKHLAKN